MKKILFPILAMLFITDCTTFTVPYRVKKNFKYCFDGEKTGLDTLINIHGYYAPDTIIRKSNNILPKDTLHPAFIFFDNGFVDADVNISFFNENVSFFVKRWGGDFGRYILHADTIKLQVVMPPGEMSRETYEVWYKIIDKNTIQKIYAGLGENEVPRILPPLNPYAEQVFIFRPFEIKIKPEDTWIYKKRWFRCKKK
jgi:hypothetical protein